MTFWPLTNSDFPTNQTFHQFHDLDTELDLHRITSGFQGAFASGVACQQGTLTLPDTWFRPPFWDLLMVQLLRLNSSNLPCHYSTFHLEYPWYFLDFASYRAWNQHALHALTLYDIRRPGTWKDSGVRQQNTYMYLLPLPSIWEYEIKVLIENRLNCGWHHFRGVPIFVVFVEGPIHEFLYPRISNFLYELYWKYYGHEFWTPSMCHFPSIHGNWYP